MPINQSPLVLHMSHAWLKVGYTAVKSRELDIVFFRDFDAISLAEFHDDVQEIHGVHFDLISNSDIPLESAQILIWQYLANHLKDDGSDLAGGHVRDPPFEQASGLSCLSIKSLHDYRRVDAQHTEGMLKDIVDFGDVSPMPVIAILLPSVNLRGPLAYVVLQCSALFCCCALPFKSQHDAVQTAASSHHGGFVSGFEVTIL